MKKLICGIALAWLTLLASPALAANCSGYAFTLTNGQTADATQVMANFNNILSCANNNLAKNGANSDITSLAGLATPITTAQGGTGVTYGLAVDVYAFVGGVTGNNWTLLRYQPSTDIILTTAKARCGAGVAATGTTTYTLKNNGAAIGTAVVTAATTTCVATITSSPYAVSAGDVLTLVGPASGDATAADIGFTFGGVRN